MNYEFLLSKNSEKWQNYTNHTFSFAHSILWTFRGPFCIPLLCAIIQIIINIFIVFNYCSIWNFVFDFILANQSHRIWVFFCAQRLIRVWLVYCDQRHISFLLLHLRLSWDWCAIRKLFFSAGFQFSHSEQSIKHRWYVTKFYMERECMSFSTPLGNGCKMSKIGCISNWLLKSNKWT